MDQNIFAIVNQNVKTVKVRYQQLDKTTKTMGFYSNEYTYVTDLDLEQGDLVVVEVTRDSGNHMSVAMVSHVDDHMSIRPNDPIEYKFIVAAVDTSRYENLMHDKEDVEAKLAQAYQRNLRNQFVQQVLADLPNDVKAQLGYEVKE